MNRMPICLSLKNFVLNISVPCTADHISCRIRVDGYSDVLNYCSIMTLNELVLLLPINKSAAADRKLVGKGCKFHHAVIVKDVK